MRRCPDSNRAARGAWSKAVASAVSLGAAPAGVVLGAFINGFKVADGAYSGGAFDWLSPFSVFTGVGLVIAYALLGSTWLVMKTEDGLQSRMKYDVVLRVPRQGESRSELSLMHAAMKRPRRLGWLVLIWFASVAALAIVAALFRALMNAAGLTAH